MVRSNWVCWGMFAVVLGSACSDDDSGDGQPAGAAGSSSGSAGNGGDGGSAGATMSNAGSGGSGEMISVAEACQRFAEVTCAKGQECGLLIPVAAPVCLRCDAVAIAIIAGECESNLSGPRNRADVDRCLDGIADNTCAEACSDAPFDDCEAFELPSGDAAVTCDPVMCLQD